MNLVRKQCLSKIFLQSNINRQNISYSLGRTSSFKSALSLENLYPKSKLKLHTPTFVSDPKAKFSGYIPLDKVKITYCSSSGPGGQNVNCVNTKVDLRFQIDSAIWLSEEIRTKIAEQYKNKINKDGYLIIKSDLTRSQHLNLADALEKLRVMIRTTLAVSTQPSPESEERKRKNLLKAARERLHEKRLHSQLKKNRQTPVAEF
ncbi:PREDICTED: peptidyl-tRNA hydrolase ICT1, mitochondrial [Cyphomyrmex costatus]|uniref:Large ribosomal subunit protein mL62 n=1 Tax=Cyphomyrmex costatus TaxID=456900 RepID=A0A195D6Z6_9HYME|nr:PREDICTED: peptidyl-tRNA hydrolase ICT1, mitochondrial [Cyphomyrmex costatus]KYN08641.1 Peptidyl-tRNA hydrolase ICT1, mitochondrial [Cyphomyrmex costatus]